MLECGCWEQLSRLYNPPPSPILDQPTSLSTTWDLLHFYAWLHGCIELGRPQCIVIWILDQGCISSWPCWTFDACCGILWGRPSQCGTILYICNSQQRSMALVHLSSPWMQAYHNGRFWMKSSIRTSFLSVRQWTSARIRVYPQTWFLPVDASYHLRKQ